MRAFASWVMSDTIWFHNLCAIEYGGMRIVPFMSAWMCGVSDIYMVFPEILNTHLKLSESQFKCYKIQLNSN